MLLGFLLGLVGGLVLAVVLGFVIERAGRGERFVATSLLRHPRTAYRMWFDPTYKAVIRDLRKMFGS